MHCVSLFLKGEDMIEPKVLTPSQLRYLLTMSAMGEDGRGIRCTDLAGSLGIAKSSVHNMIKTFIELGYVSKDGNGLAYFTDEGREAAVSFNRYYSVISSVLRENFPGIEDIGGAACYLISEMSEEDLEKLAEKHNV